MDSRPGDEMLLSAVAELLAVVGQLSTPVPALREVI
jgi:hypothetical protein